MGVPNFIADAIKYQLDPKPAEHFPNVIPDLKFDDRNPNKPIGPWKLDYDFTKATYIDKHGKKRTWGGFSKKVYKFGDQPNILRRYPLDETTKQWLKDPAFTVGYNVIKDPGGEWISLARKPPDVNDLVKAGAAGVQVVGSVFANPDARWALRLAFEKVINSIAGG
jgi:hypothetical protein